MSVKLSARIIVSAIVILHFQMMLVAPLYLLHFTHFILDNKSQPLVSMFC